MSPVSIEDPRRAARARLPRAIVDFVDGGAQDVARRIHWLRDVALGPRVSLTNLLGTVVGYGDIISIAHLAQEQYDLTLNWKDLDWVRSLWRAKLAIKGGGPTLSLRAGGRRGTRREPRARDLT